MLLSLALAGGFLPRWNQRRVVAQQTTQLALTRVRTITPTPAPAAPPILFSGEIRPAVEAAIYARTSGYVRRWAADLGSKVEQGALLAELDTPDLDRALSEAQAELAQAEASLKLAQATSARWAEMLHTRTVSPQEAEEKTADFKLKQALLEAAHSHLQRIEEVKRFAQITAPFAGTIVERMLEVGQLFNAGTEHPMFKLAQIDKVRVFVRIPQTHARSVSISQSAEILVPELPETTFQAKVVRSAGAIDPASRTLLVELEMENPHGTLLPGSYAQVRIPEALPNSSLTIPANCLIYSNEGVRAAVVGSDHRAQLRVITLGKDLGPRIEILSGLQTSDRVILSPPDSLLEGAPVLDAEDP